MSGGGTLLGDDAARGPYEPVGEMGCISRVVPQMQYGLAYIQEKP